MFVELLYPQVMRGENDNKSIENKTRKREGKKNSLRIKRVSSLPLSF